MITSNGISSLLAFRSIGVWWRVIYSPALDDFESAIFPLRVAEGLWTAMLAGAPVDRRKHAGFEMAEPLQRADELRAREVIARALYSLYHDDAASHAEIGVIAGLRVGIVLRQQCVGALHRRLVHG